MTAHTFILWTGQCSIDSNDLTKLTASQGGLADHTHSGASTYLITVSLTVEEQLQTKCIEGARLPVR